MRRAAALLGVLALVSASISCKPSKFKPTSVRIDLRELSFRFEPTRPDEGLSDAWKASDSPPDARCSIGAIPSMETASEQGSESGAKGPRPEFQPSAFFFSHVSVGGTAPDAAVYGISARGYLTWDLKAGWRWLKKPKSYRDFESELLMHVIHLRDEAITTGIPSGESMQVGLWVGEEPCPTFDRGEITSSLNPRHSGSLKPRSPVWPLSIYEDYLLVVPGVETGRDGDGKHEILSDVHRTYAQWSTKDLVWIRWRTDGPVPGSKRILIRTAF